MVESLQVSVSLDLGSLPLGAAAGHTAPPGGLARSPGPTGATSGSGR